jgi:hypothetical protein
LKAEAQREERYMAKLFVAQVGGLDELGSLQLQEPAEHTGKPLQKKFEAVRLMEIELLGELVLWEVVED